MFTAALALVVALGTCGEGPGSEPAVPRVVPTSASAPAVVLAGRQAVKGDQARPTVRIAAEPTVEPGEMVVVAAVVDGPLPPNLVQMKYRWIVLKNGVPITNYLPFPDNAKFVFGAGLKPAVFTVMLDVDVLYGTAVDASGKPIMVGDKQAVLDAAIDGNPLVVEKITVGDPPAPDPGPGPGPTPPPGPGPGPTPPPTPPVLTGYAKVVYDFVQGQVPDFTQAEKYAICQSLGTNFKTQATRIAAGVDDMRNPKTILAVTKATNNAAITQSGIVASRLDNIKASFGDYLKKLHDNNELVDAETFQKVWNEISAGLLAIPAK